MSDTYTVIADGECVTIICSMHSIRLMFTAMQVSSLWGAVEVWHEGKKIMDSTTGDGLPSNGNG